MVSQRLHTSFEGATAADAAEASVEERHRGAEKKSNPGRASRFQWGVTCILIGLSIVPALAGMARLFELAIGAEVTAGNYRFFTTPLPVVLHILAVIPFSVLGAPQLSPGLRRRSPRWHRLAGRALMVLGATAAVTGLWMAHFYEWPEGDGFALYILRLVVGAAMLTAILMAAVALGRRAFSSHGAWMVRAYALSMGAGTQVLTHAIYFLLAGKPDQGSRTVLMGLGWLINALAAEWVIRKGASLWRL